MLTADLIQGFTGSVLASRFDDSVRSPAFHYELWQEACSDHKYVAISAPRGHAKSTAGTLAYGLCSLLFREAKFLLIVSDTESQASMFLNAIKSELLDNEAIGDLFQLKKNEKGLVVLEKDTETDMVVCMADGHKFRVVAKGAEQKLRGLLWNGTRPDLVIIDDLENDELVMNKDRRTKLRRWFFAALIPAMSPRGKLRYWGTILHMDALLESFMPREYARDTVHDGLRTYSTRPRQMWRGVKYAAHNPDFSLILWKERYSKEFFIEKKEEFLRQGIPDVYSQEYLNIPLDESVAYFKRNDLIERKEEDKKFKLTYYITADLAISERETADYSVFLVAGVDENRIVHVVNVLRERLDGKEIVDTILALHRTYKPVAIGVEEMQVSKAIGPFLREEMLSQNTFPTLIPMKHMGKDKQSRARSIQARVRAKTVKFNKEDDWYPDFEDEVLKFPRAKHDDQVDAFAYLGLLLDKIIESPTAEEEEEEEYQDELKKTGFGLSGRSRLTGY